MKLKILFPVTVSLLIGTLCGKLIFSQYKNNIKEVAFEGKPIYILQQGVYSSKESMEENTSKISDYLYIKENNLYYVYLGITTNKEITDIAKKAYENIDIYVKENIVSNEELISSLKENDQNINIDSNKADILSFLRNSLTIYEEKMTSAKS